MRLTTKTNTLFHRHNYNYCPAHSAECTRNASCATSFVRIDSPETRKLLRNENQTEKQLENEIIALSAQAHGHVPASHQIH